MKINLKDKAEVKEMYQVGNVIKDYKSNNLFLIANDVEDGFAFINLTRDKVIGHFKTLEELINEYGDKSDVLANVEINVL